jgi:hypothetical protein
MPSAGAFCGMYVAAWAQVESCDVLVHDGAIELSARHEPSDELGVAFAQMHKSVVGVLGWGVPLERPRKRSEWSATVVQWRTGGIGASGEFGRN